jgi:CubicO group peptidase (beta-lactamase class C family)
MTPFQIASISKHFTAAAALWVIERGMASLTDPVARWFPTADSRWRDVTVHQLLSHTGGVGHWEDYPEIDLFERPKVEMTRLILDRPPDRTLLGQFYYSSPGYVLLSHIVEEITAEPYRSFVQKQLFDPAGMVASFIGEPVPGLEVAVPQHGRTAVRSFELDFVARGAGDMWSTADDLVRWDSALRDGAVLTEKYRTLAFSRQADVPESDNAYGYGWTLGAFGGRPARFHGGDNHAYRSLHVWWPEDDLRLVVLTNSQLTSHEDIHEMAHLVRHTF